MSERITGTIKTFNADKGHGYIERQGGPDIYFHISAFRSANPPTLRVGQTVEFNIVRGPIGPQAVNIVITR